MRLVPRNKPIDADDNIGRGMDFALVTLVFLGIGWGIDRAAGKVLCRQRPAVPYDLCAINIGSTPQVRQVPGATEHTVPVKPIQQFNERWLALLVTNAVDDPDIRPLMHLAVRRGLLMEELLRAQGDSGAASEAFICGVFSLLDRMLGQPFDRLLGNLPVAEGVAQTLGSGQGPYSGPLQLALPAGGAAGVPPQPPADAWPV